MRTKAPIPLAREPHRQADRHTPAGAWCAGLLALLLAPDALAQPPAEQPRDRSATSPEQAGESDPEADPVDNERPGLEGDAADADTTGDGGVEAHRGDPPVDFEDRRGDLNAPTEEPGARTSEPAVVSAATPEDAPEPSLRNTPATCAETARARASDAVVRVRSGGRWGAGFVYGSPRHVVTSFRLMARGRPVNVVTRDGRHLDARLLAKDEAYDLAVLSVQEPVSDAEPLSPAPETSARVGATVVALGHPFAGVAFLLGERAEGLLTWSVSQGTIGAVNERGVQADLALTTGHAGAPLLDCAGRVIGMVTGAGRLSDDLGLVARIGRVDELVSESDGPQDFIGDLDLRFGLGGGLIIDEDGNAAGGFYLTLGATLFDRISWVNRVGLFLGGLPDPTEEEARTLLSEDRDIVRFTSLLGWRFFIDVGGITTLYVVPEGGVSVYYDQRDAARVTVVSIDDTSCVPSGTETCARADIVRTSTSEWYVRPALGLTFLIGGNLEVGYTFEVAVEDEPIETTHVLRLGLQM